MTAQLTRLMISRRVNHVGVNLFQPTFVFVQWEIGLVAGCLLFVFLFVILLLSHLFSSLIFFTHVSASMAWISLGGLMLVLGKESQCIVGLEDPGLYGWRGHWALQHGAIAWSLKNIYSWARKWVGHCFLSIFRVHHGVSSCFCNPLPVVLSGSSLPGGSFHI